MKETRLLRYLRKNRNAANGDEVDFPPNEYIFRKRDVIFLIGAIATYIIDLVFDIITAYNHLHHGNFNFFYMTVVFIVVPSVIITIISLWWYLHDNFNENDRKNNCSFNLCIRSLFLICQLAPILRYIECLSYGIKSRKEYKNGNKALQRHFYTLMLYEDADCVLLRLVESFLESIPQLILQLHILLCYPTLFGDSIWSKLLWLSCLSSLLSVSWGVTAYFRDSRFTDISKNNISLIGSILILLWQFFSIGSRVLALVIFSILVELWIVILCLAHLFLMFLWLIIRRSFKQIGNSAYEILLSIVFAAIYIFAFINDKDESTRLKYVAFYTLFALENVAMVTLWLIYGDCNSWFYYTGIFVHYASFLLAFIFMGIYYGACHPTLQIKKQSSSMAESTCSSSRKYFNKECSVNFTNQGEKSTTNSPSDNLPATSEVSALRSTPKSLTQLEGSRNTANNAYLNEDRSFTHHSLDTSCTQPLELTNHSFKQTSYL